MASHLIDLFERARQGDDRALEQLLRELCDRFHWYAYRLLGHRQDAEDAAQEAAWGLVQCVNRVTATYQFDDDRMFEGFVFTIVARVARGILAQRETTLEPTDYRLTALMDPLSEDNSASRADDIRCLMEAVALMSADDVRLIEMRYIQGLDSKQIERLTGTNANTIRARLVRARQRLREVLLLQAPQLAARLFEETKE